MKRKQQLKRIQWTEQPRIYFDNSGRERVEQRPNPAMEGRANRKAWKTRYGR